jgi:ribosomal-protein-alanine N-acetyltransferase
MSAVIESLPDGLRPMRVEDLDAVMEIEHAVYPFPWTKGIFHDCIRVGYQCDVYQNNGEILAYSVLSIAAGEAHLLTFSVAPEHQNKGLGKMMLQNVTDEATFSNVQSVLLEVRPSNHTAIHLYQKMGFIEVGIRPDYYPDENGREDALIMARELFAD